MAAQKKNSKVAEEYEEVISEPEKPPQSLEIAKRGIRTANDLAGLMGALIVDLIEGTVAPETSDAICEAAGNLLDAVEIQYDYAAKNNTTDRKNLIVITAEAPPQP
jgi:hypothetical protein